MASASAIVSQPGPGSAIIATPARSSVKPKMIFA